MQHCARSRGQEENQMLAMPEGLVAQAAEIFTVLSGREADAPMVHVIDRDGRHAGIVHGAHFGRINMVLYINGLTNAPPSDRP